MMQLRPSRSGIRMSTTTASGDQSRTMRRPVIHRFGGHDLVIHAVQHVSQMAQHQGVILDDKDAHAQPQNVSILEV